MYLFVITFPSGGFGSFQFTMSCMRIIGNSCNVYRRVTLLISCPATAGEGFEEAGREGDWLGTYSYRR